MSYKIAIEGNIGCGKTTLMSRLCQETRLPIFLEPVDEWKDWLTLFYSDPSRWGMSFNINVLLTFNKWKNNNFTSIYERSPISNRFVFSQLQHDNNNMKDVELKMFERVYDKLAWTPDVIIYIRTDPEVSMTRMQERARQCEDAVPLEYITSVHNKYEEILNNKPYDEHNCYLDAKFTTSDKEKCRIIQVDGNKSADEVYQDVKQWVEAYMDN
jgi:deoxyadenosine/deoxycytidine kinase